jgi:hypothetical protein
LNKRSPLVRKMTGKTVRRMIADATMGASPNVLVEPSLQRSYPRLYDETTDFGDLKGYFGVYLIYAAQWSRNQNLGASRIQYIGRGHLGMRLNSHLEKVGLLKLSRQAKLKFIGYWVDDEDFEFVFEAVLLNEHQAVFGALPRFNRAPGSKTVLGWRHVIRMSPGPRTILSKYGNG